jgi:hypothetical protein
MQSRCCNHSIPPSHNICTPIASATRTSALLRPPEMLAQRLLARQAPRVALRSQRTATPIRAAGRRTYSSESPKQFAGGEDNEFNRERARIAEHAYESGEFWRKLTL